MIFISAQPYDVYFLWQCEVQIVNFRKFDISKNMNILVWHPELAELTERETKTGKFIRKYKAPPDLSGWHKLQEKYPEVKIYFYKDEGVNLSLYIPQLRPQILKKHFSANPFLEKTAVFYHDSDILFNYLPDFESLLSDNINWQSDCSHYLDYGHYLRVKEQQGNIPEDEAIGKLAEIGRVTVDILKAYTGKTGGAQCILKMVDADFWADVERQCLEIRKAFTHKDANNVRKTPENMAILANSINTKYFPSEEAGFQSWCADMWALNMALWSRGKVTDVTPQLDFSWATNTMEVYNQKPIFHNAGATRETPELFYKADWKGKSPIGANIPAPPENSAQYAYWKAIQEVNNI